MLALHKRGLKLIMDFVPNHTSDEHPWFLKSKKGEGKYKDYYIWAKGRGGGPPNNWVSIHYIIQFNRAILLTCIFTEIRLRRIGLDSRPG